MTATVDKTVRTPTEYPHIERDYQGRPVIKGTRMRVSMIVQEMFGVNRFTPDDMVENFPELLTIVKVYEALAYYHKHKKEIDDKIVEEHRFADEMREKNHDPAFSKMIVERAKARGILVK